MRNRKSRTLTDTEEWGLGQPLSAAVELDHTVDRKVEWANVHAAHVSSHNLGKISVVRRQSLARERLELVDLAARSASLARREASFEFVNVTRRTLKEAHGLQYFMLATSQGGSDPSCGSQSL